MHDQTSFRISKTMLKLILSVIFIHQVSSLECDSTDSTFNSQDGPCKQCLSINNVAHGCKEQESYYIPFDYCFARSDSEECKCVCQEDNCNSSNELKCKAKEVPCFTNQARQTFPEKIVFRKVNMDFFANFLDYFKDVFEETDAYLEK